MRLSLGSHHVMCLFCLVMLLCACTSGVISHDPKNQICCTPEILRNQIKHVPRVITGCIIVSATSKCVEAVIFRGQNNRMRCIDPKAPWLDEKVKALEENGVRCLNRTKS